MMNTSQAVQRSGKTSQPIVFFGTEDFSLTSLEALIEANFNIVAVVTKPDFRSGRGQKLTAPAVKSYALEHSIPVWQPQKLSEITEQIRALHSPAGVLVSYGKIIPNAIISLFTPGIINLHPSLLPLYRGPSPIESVILARDAVTGISLMELEARMDAGPVYYQETVALDHTETQSSLAAQLGKLGATRLVEYLPHILDGTIKPRTQDESRATYCHLLQKSDAFFDPNSLSAAALEARIRAYQKFPRTKYEFHSHHITITKAHVATTRETNLDIQCQDENFVVIDEIMAPNGKTMSAASFLRGYAH